MMTKILLATLVSGYAYAAPAPIKFTTLADVKMAIALPLENRLQTLRGMDGATIGHLESLAFSPTESLDHRWRALTAAGRLYPKQAVPMLERAMKSTDWFMRNAALVVVPYGERDWAVKWSKVMMHDQALVVRTAAVEAIRKIHAVEATDLLWEKLYSSENYNKGKSLWIRRHIADTLASFAHPGQEKSFAKLLKDEDASLHAHATRALNRISQKTLTKEEWISTVQ